MIIDKDCVESIHLSQIDLDMLDSLLQNGTIHVGNMRKKQKYR